MGSAGRWARDLQDHAALSLAALPTCHEALKKVADPVTDAILHLVERGVRRIEALEVLLLMARQPDRAWSLDDVHASSAFVIRVTHAGSGSLEGVGLVTRTADGEHLVLDKGIAELLRPLLAIVVAGHDPQRSAGVRRRWVAPVSDADANRRRT
ncbi:hypothetical protein SAMN02745121_09200, partial [Nannocystis exedens]